MNPATPRGRKGIWIVVLAAGGSRRLGRPKQLLRLRGRTLLCRTTQLADALAPARVVVVVGSDRLRMLRHLRRGTRPVRFAVNPKWQTGMSGSLITGIRALPRSATAALVLVTDQPRVGRADLERLIARWGGSRSRPAAAAYAGRVGVPAIIPRRLFRALGAGDGDSGARGLLRASAALRTVPVPSAAFDIDTPADLAALVQPGG